MATIPDTTNMTLAEISELITALSAAYTAKQQAEAQDSATARTRLLNARQELVNLLGPVNAAPADMADPTTINIRSVLAHGAPIITANAALVTPYIVAGLEASVSSMINAIDALGSD